MDKVFIEQLRVETLIGVYDWERLAPRPLLLDICMAWDNRPAAASDGLQHALDYAAVSEYALNFAQRQDFELLEAFAELLAQELMEKFGIPWLRLKVNKPGAVAQAASVGVEIERGCP